MILILTGLSGSGKTTAADFLKKKNIPTIHMGDITFDALKRNKIPLIERNEKIFRENIRHDLGNDIFARKVLPKVLRIIKKSPLAVIEGMRSIDEYIFFRERLSDIRIVFIDTKKSIRFERLIKRKTRALSKIQAREREKYEVNTLGINKLRKHTDFVIENNETEKKFYSKLNQVISRLKNLTSKY